MEATSGVAIKSTDVMGVTFGFASFDALNPPSIFTDFNFVHGYIGFILELASPGDSTSLSMALPSGQNVAAYFKFGGTPDNPTPHWYRFDFDGETGAEISGNLVTLHFVDGKRGDSDLDDTNGIIVDPGAPALSARTSGQGGDGSGCSLHDDETLPAHAGAWWLLMAFLSLLGIRRRVYQRVDW